MKRLLSEAIDLFSPFLKISQCFQRLVTLLVKQNKSYLMTFAKKWPFHTLKCHWISLRWCPKEKLDPFNIFDILKRYLRRVIYYSLLSLVSNKKVTTTMTIFAWRAPENGVKPEFMGWDWWLPLQIIRAWPKFENELLLKRTRRGHLIFSRTITTNK